MASTITVKYVDLRWSTENNKKANYSVERLGVRDMENPAVRTPYIPSLRWGMLTSNMSCPAVAATTLGAARMRRCSTDGKQTSDSLVGMYAYR